MCRLVRGLVSPSVCPLVGLSVGWAIGRSFGRSVNQRTPPVAQSALISRALLQYWLWCIVQGRKRGWDPGSGATRWWRQWLQHQHCDFSTKTETSQLTPSPHTREDKAGGERQTCWKTTCPWHGAKIWIIRQKTFQVLKILSCLAWSSFSSFSSCSEVSLLDTD